MSIFSSRNERLFKRFPWLWGILPIWSDSNTITITTLKEHVLQNKLDKNSLWWVRVNKTDRRMLLRLRGGKKVSLAEALYAINGDSLFGNNISHLVFKDLDGNITIHLPDRKESIDRWVTLIVDRNAYKKKLAREKKLGKPQGHDSAYDRLKDNSTATTVAFLAAAG